MILHIFRVCPDFISKRDPSSSVSRSFPPPFGILKGKSVAKSIIIPLQTRDAICNQSSEAVSSGFFHNYLFLGGQNCAADTDNTNFAKPIPIPPTGSKSIPIPILQMGLSSIPIPIPIPKYGNVQYQYQFQYRPKTPIPQYQYQY